VGVVDGFDVVLAVVAAAPVDVDGAGVLFEDDAEVDAVDAELVEGTGADVGAIPPTIAISAQFLNSSPQPVVDCDVLLPGAPTPLQQLPQNDPHQASASQPNDFMLEK